MEMGFKIHDYPKTLKYGKILKLKIFLFKLLGLEANIKNYL